MYFVFAYSTPGRFLETLFLHVRVFLPPLIEVPPTPALTRVPTPEPTGAPSPSPTDAPTYAPALLEPVRREHNSELSYSGEGLTFHEARASCLQEGGDLVTIRSLAENKAVANFVRQINDQEGQIWIGLEDYETEVNFLFCGICFLAGVGS